MEKATEIINAAIPAETETVQGRVVVGTVEGDMHDIGKTIVIALLKANGFDGRGNYNLGVTEQIIFPEIDIDKVNKLAVMDITFVTSAKTDAEAKELLALMGMPFSTSN